MDKNERIKEEGSVCRASANERARAAGPLDKGPTRTVPFFDPTPTPLTTTGTYNTYPTGDRYEREERIQIDRQGKVLLGWTRSRGRELWPLTKLAKERRPRAGGLSLLGGMQQNPSLMACHVYRVLGPTVNVSGFTLT